MGARNFFDDFAGGWIVGRQRVNGNGVGGHGKILAQGGCAQRTSGVHSGWTVTPAARRDFETAAAILLEPGVSP